MTTIIAIFFIACAASLVLTPQVARLALHFGLVDQPNNRNVHDRPIPRIGGLAIYLAFFIAFVPLIFPGLVQQTTVLEMLIGDPRLAFLVMGSCVVIAVGIYDDSHSLSPFVKFGVQALAATIAWAGDIRIDVLWPPVIGDIQFAWLSLPVTIFWILLVINAINLIDGLDGLAAGVSFFVCMVLLVLSVVGDRILPAVILAALAGSILGFLRYNFNPARIFMGDSGSYFLGYMLATLSILGRIKGQTTLALMIPIIALGVPLIDTMWSTVRRFMVGKKLFRPDKDHIHHRLLKMGMTHRKAVLILYGVTVALGIFALLLVNARSEQTGLILLVLGVLVIFGIRRLGYIKYLQADRVYGWIKELGDVSGISHERRSFLNLQIKTSQSRTITDLWENIAKAALWLEFDVATLYLSSPADRRKVSAMSNERRKVPRVTASVTQRQGLPNFNWTREGIDPHGQEDCSRNLFRLELPLIMDTNRSFGTLVLIKDLKAQSVGHYTLQRVEHLRRTVVRTLCEL